MIDLNDKVPFMGHVGVRATQAVEALRNSGEITGYFTHNDIQLTVYPDSTHREIYWQYEAKSQQRSKDGLMKRLNADSRRRAMERAESINNQDD